MAITWLGAICFPIGLLLLLAAPRWLHGLTIFFIPFTATSLLNTASDVPLSPLQFFGALFIVQQALLFLARGQAKWDFRGERSLILLFLFLIVVLLSMIMPAIIDGRLWIASATIFDLYDTPVHLTASTIKYPLPVIFGVTLVTFLVLRNDTPDKIVSAARIYVAAGVFVALWGYLQFLCDSVLYIPYPHYVFNNALLETMQGYNQIDLDSGGESFSRLSSVTHEPSVFAKFLLTVISIMLYPVLARQPLLGHVRDRMVLVTLVGVLLLATSATGYLGLVIALMTTAALMHKRGQARIGWMLWLVPVGVLAVLAVAASPVLMGIADAQILSKLASGSALSRLFSIVTAWDYFQQYPLLGVGWATVTSNDLVVNLLANTGIMGLCAFLALVWAIVRSSLRSLSRSTAATRDMSAVSTLLPGLLTAFVVLLVTGLFSGLEFYLGYFYFILAMLVAANIAVRGGARADSGIAGEGTRGDLAPNPRP